MSGLYGVMDEVDNDTIWTYEADSKEEAAKLYLNDPDMNGVVIRVWTLGRHPGAFIRTKDGSIKELHGPGAVQK